MIIDHGEVAVLFVFVCVVVHLRHAVSEMQLQQQPSHAAATRITPRCLPAIVAAARRRQRVTHRATILYL